MTVLRISYHRVLICNPLNLLKRIKESVILRGYEEKINAVRLLRGLHRRAIRLTIYDESFLLNPVLSFPVGDDAEIQVFGL